MKIFKKKPKLEKPVVPKPKAGIPSARLEKIKEEKKKSEITLEKLTEKLDEILDPKTDPITLQAPMVDPEDELMKKFEAEKGKHAVWGGKKTKGYLAWKEAKGYE